MKDRYENPVPRLFSNEQYTLDTFTYNWYTMGRGDDMEINYRSKSNNPIYNKVYQLWYNMNARCHNPKNPYFKNYGGKGIVVCEKWRELDGFIEDVDKIKGFDMELFLEGKLYIDKDSINLDNKLYCLEECEFVTIEASNKMKQNQQRFFIATSPTGEEFKSYNQSEVARKHSLRQSKISECLKGVQKSHKGWTFRYQ